MNQRLRLPSELQEIAAVLVWLAGLDPYLRFMELNQTFDNSRLLADTKLPPRLPPHEYLKMTGKYVNQIDLVAGALDP